ECNSPKKGCLDDIPLRKLLVAPSHHSAMLNESVMLPHPYDNDVLNSRLRLGDSPPFLPILLQCGTLDTKASLGKSEAIAPPYRRCIHTIPESTAGQHHPRNAI